MVISFYPRSNSGIFYCCIYKISSTDNRNKLKNKFFILFLYKVILDLVISLFYLNISLM